MKQASSSEWREGDSSSAQIRRVGISRDCWYVIARSSDIQTRPVGRTLWKQPVVLFRSASGDIHALEDCCAHRLVRLSHGRIIEGDQIECAYHGWRFDGQGHCVHIPHLSSKPTLPKCSIKSFPVLERHGFVWIFPGHPDRARDSQPMEMSEWDDLNEIRSITRFTCRAHFSYLVENLMDMYHGRLHAQYQVWTAEALLEVLQSQTQVTARYEATTHYRVEGLGSILQLFIPGLRKLYTAPLTVTYDYPHWRSTLGDDFKIFCLVCPVHERLTEAYLIHYTSLKKFTALSNLPVGVRRLIKGALNNVARRLLKNLVDQDVLMMEQEQAAFDDDPLRQPFEVNRTILRVQQLIRQRAARAAGKRDDVPS